MTKAQSLALIGNNRGTKPDDGRILDDEVVNGLLLSDASLVRLKTKYQTSGLTITQSESHAELIDFFEEHLHNLWFDTIRHTRLKWNKYAQITLQTKRYGCFTRLRELWYLNGKKIVPKNLKLTKKTLAFFLMGDGNSAWRENRVKKVRVTFATDGFNLNDVKLLQDKIIEMGIYTSISRHKNDYRLSIGRTSEVIKMNEFVRPYILPCFMYKIKNPLVTYSLLPKP